MGSDIFISYKSEEFAEADELRRNFEENGITCWMAPMCIKGGSSYAKEIPAAIRSSKAFVLILSKAAQDSKWVSRELDQAINHDKIVLPFMIENCEISDDFEFYLTNVQRYAAYEDKQSAMDKIIEDAKSYLGISGKASDAKAEEEEITEIAPPEEEEITEIAPPEEEEITEIVTPEEAPAEEFEAEEPVEETERKDALRKRKTEIIWKLSVIAIMIVVVLIPILNMEIEENVEFIEGGSVGGGVIDVIDIKISMPDIGETFGDIEFEHPEGYYVAIWTAYYCSDEGVKVYVPMDKSILMNKEYVYELVIMPKFGYDFDRNTIVKINGDVMPRNYDGNSISVNFTYLVNERTITPG